MKNIIDLTNKTILVTGAGSGIGRATCLIASQVGAKVILLDISQVGMDETLSRMEGQSHVSYQIDLMDVDNISVLSKEIIAEHGKLHGLVHCAGVSSRKPLNVLNKDGFDKLMSINFYSFVELVKDLSKKGRMFEGASIAVMSSISSIKGYKAKTEYCVSKASVDAFVRCMSLELAPRKIRVNSVMASTVDTPLANKAIELNVSLGKIDDVVPLGMTEPEEVANTICFLLSDATKTITGTSILIDGGATV